MDDLTAFITARLDEDEAAAKAAWGVEWDWRYVAEPFGERPSIAHTVHIARHDPARVLREVEGGRRTLARYQDCLARMENPDYPAAVARDQAREYEDFVLPNLAAAWNDHPDCRPEWQP